QAAGAAVHPVRLPLHDLSGQIRSSPSPSLRFRACSSSPPAHSCFERLSTRLRPWLVPPIGKELRSKRKLWVSTRNLAPMQSHCPQAQKRHRSGSHRETGSGRVGPRECPLWVKSGHWGTSEQCPLYPPKADIGRRASDVRQVPKADINGRAPAKLGFVRSRASREATDGGTMDISTFVNRVGG